MSGFAGQSQLEIQTIRSEAPGVGQANSDFRKETPARRTALVKSRCGQNIMEARSLLTDTFLNGFRADLPLNHSKVMAVKMQIHNEMAVRAVLMCGTPTPTLLN